jgi:site-specific recombinase XerD
MNERDLLRTYPEYAPYQEALREIFEELPPAFIRRFPALAARWEPFLRHLLDRDFDIDHLRKAASDIRDFQQWLLDKNMDLSNIPPSLIREFVRDLRARFRKRNQHPMDSRAILDVCQAIECFLNFAVDQNRDRPPDPESAS